MTSREWTQEAVAERLKDLFAPDAALAGNSLTAAAAVLSTFDVETLKPFGTPPADPFAARADLLASAAETVTPDGRKRWVLARESRRELLRELIQGAQVESALAANPERERDDVQQMLETVLRNPTELPPLTHPQQVRAYQIVTDWLSGLVPGLLDQQSLRNLADRATLLAAFHDLVGEYFAGRTTELAALADYVDVRDASGAVEYVTRTIRSVLSIVEEPPLFISGPGGIGKSTLIAKFILDHVDDASVPRFPYAYLDLDRPGLVAEEPITLLIEALRQLAMQYPESRTSLAELQREWATKISDTAAVSPPVQGTPPPGQEQRTDDDGTEARSLKRFETVWSRLRLGERDYYLETFAHIVRSLEPTPRPMLLVLDTFEEVQLRSAAYVGAVFTLLERLQKQLPFLRTVLCGRVAPAGYKVKELKLTSFDLPAATAYLTARVKVDRETAETVARQLTGSPLALKLAADLLAQAQAVPGGLTDLSPIIGELKKGSIEGQLYTRVLKHIVDPDVRKIAHPGLILRRITPEIIQRVLAGPCGLTVPDEPTAQRLFQKLKDEVVLVTERSPGVLVHRPELREVMLRPLVDAERERVRQIHEAAVRYYETQPAIPELRAEEIYHRLSLGFDRPILESRWIDGMDRFLAGALPDLSPKARGFLAARLDLALDPASWQQTDMQDWEVYALREGRDYLRLGRIEQALDLLGRRQGFTSIDLKILRVEALARTADLGAAVRAARETLAQVPPDSADARRLQAIIRTGEAASPPPPSSFRPRSKSSDSTVTSPRKGVEPELPGGPPIANATIRTVADALADAFTSTYALNAMLADYGVADAIGPLGIEAPLPTGREAASLALLVASHAASRNALGQLLVAARRARPDNGRLWSAAAELGVMARGMADFSTIQQSILQGRAAGELRAALTRLEGQVCRVETNGPEKTFVSGFLVGPDLVLTAAVQLGEAKPDLPVAPDLRYVVTFDRWTTATDKGLRVDGVQVRGAEPKALVAASPATRQTGLGYMLLRLETLIGEAPGAVDGRRGWISLSTSIPVTPQTAVAMLRFDSSQALTLSVNPTGMRERDDANHRLHYEIEGETGGSGSPVFDAQLRLVALHIARSDTTWLGAITRAQRRVGTVVGAIVDDLASRGIYLPPPPTSQDRRRKAV